VHHISVAMRRVRRSHMASKVAPLWGAEGVSLTTGLLQTVVVARLLGVQKYGLVALAMAVPTLIFTFFSPQASESIVRYVTRFVEDDDPDRAAAAVRLAYVADGLLALFGVLAVIAVAPWAADHVLKDSGSSHLLLFYAMGLCASAPILTSRAIFMSFDHYAAVARLASIAAVLRTSLVVTMVAVGWGVNGFIVGYATSLVLEGFATMWFAHRVFFASTGRTWHSVSTSVLGVQRRSILSFMLYTELTSLTAVLAKQADVVLLGAASGPQEAGVYRLAWTIVAPVTRIATPLQHVVYPRAARLAALADWDGLRSLLWQQTVRVGLPLSGMVLCTVPIVTFAVPRIAGQDYSGAANPAAVLLVGTAATLTLFWTRPAYLASGLVRPLLVISTIAGGLTLIAFVIAAPLAGATGVAAVRALLTGLIGSSASAAYMFRRLAIAASGSAVPRPSKAKS
jgi:O-antigen/teichoic acid export membrane protein